MNASRKSLQRDMETQRLATFRRHDAECEDWWVTIEAPEAGIRIYAVDWFGWTE